MPHHHHNPLDRSDPLAPAFYFTFVNADGRDSGRGGGGGGQPGLGFFFFLLAVIAATILFLLIIGLT